MQATTIKHSSLVPPLKPQEMLFAVNDRLDKILTMVCEIVEMADNGEAHDNIGAVGDILAEYVANTRRLLN